MSEEKEVPEVTEVTELSETPEPQEHHPVKQSSGSSGSFLAVIIALSAAGGGYYLWQQQQAMKDGNRALEQRIDRLLAVVEQGSSSQAQRIEALAGHRHAETEQQLTRIEAQVAELGGRVGRDRSEWAVAETEYLLRMADHRLRLEHDPATAISALTEARQRLARQDRTGYQAVIQQISADIDALSRISLPDRDRIAEQLATLIDASQSWPSSVAPATEGTPPTRSATTPPPADTAGNWQTWLGRIWQDIKGLITIRHDGTIPAPMLEPKHQYFLQQNLQLKLESARLALLAGNGRAYTDSLVEAADWLQRYFDTSAAAVQQAQGTLKQLAAIALEPELPALGNSIELLRRAAASQAPVQSPSTPRTMPIPPETPAADSPAPSTGQDAQAVEPAATDTPDAPSEAPAAENPAQPEGSGQ